MPQLQQLYQYLEVEFDPLHLCGKVKNILTFMSNVEETSYLNQYIPALEEITLTRLVKQIAQIYSTIELNRLLQLAPFATAFDLERIVVNAVRHNDMQIRIDHRSRCLHFGSELFEAQREDLPEGPTLQAMPSEQIRTHLISMYCVLSKAATIVEGSLPTAEDKQLKKSIATLYHQNKVRARPSSQGLDFLVFLIGSAFYWLLKALKPIWRPSWLLPSKNLSYIVHVISPSLVPSGVESRACKYQTKTLVLCGARVETIRTC